MLRIENLSKSFGNLKVLQSVNLTVEKGERIAIIGKSGCGKSLFLRLLELLEQPDEGQIFIGDDEITAKGANVDAIRMRMGMVYQGFHLFEHMNVMENLLLAPMHLRKMPRQQAEQKADELLRMVGLECKRHAMPGTLSGGEKQRVAICRCLTMEPQIMLFDEPTSALDPTMVGEVLASIRMLAKQNMTMLIVTHEMGFAREFATRILYFDECGIYEEGSPQAFFDHPQKPKTQAFIHKLKYFNQHIDRRDFALMSLYAGIQNFSIRYGFSKKHANRLQLCSEELINEMLTGAGVESEPVDLDISVEYSETDKTTLLQVFCRGQPYNPFDCENDMINHLGITVLNCIAKEINVTYENHCNQISIRL